MLYNKRHEINKNSFCIQRTRTGNASRRNGGNSGENGRSGRMRNLWEREG